ncbi:MAG: AsmA family protein [Candidatus Omnitrophota bacterium]
MKKVFVILLILIFILAGGLFYLNGVFLPTKIRSLIVDTLAEKTNQQVTLEALNFSIFKGLVIKNLVISGKEGVIAKIERASCGFLILPIFKKTLLIPALNIESAFLFVERRKDKTFNLQELFGADTAAAKKPRFNLFVRKVTVKRGRVRFLDNALEPPLGKEIEELNLNLYFSLPDKVRFNLTGEVPAEPKIKFKASGAYSILDKKLDAKVYLQDFSPGEFSAYYSGWGIEVSDGRIDGQAELKYDAKEKRLSYSGKAALINGALRGIKFVDQISQINAEVAFDESGISSQNLNAVILGTLVRANFSLSDFNKPLVSAEIASDLELDSLQGILKDKFAFSVPAEIKGNAMLYLSLQGALGSAEDFLLSGYLDISQATVKPEILENPIENLNGRIVFSENQLQWPVLEFEYQGISYSSSGALNDFKAPQVKFLLSSEELSLESAFNLSDKAVQLSNFSGKYLNSRFSINGKIDIAKPADPYLDLAAQLQIDLSDSGKLLKNLKSEIEKIKPAGIVDLNLDLEGRIKDFKSCEISAQLKSNSVSFYGLKSQEFFLDYNQADGLASIPAMRLSLYSGMLKAGAQMQLYPANLPYRLKASLENLKIEQLKLDTPLKEEVIAGTLSGQAVLSGELKDISKLGGSGEIFITGGKLWQLNLFKGMGTLIFVKDFANIVFEDGRCNFVIRDKNIFTDNLRLASSISEIDGSLKLGFDSSLDARLNVKILSEEIPLTGTFRDIATAIVGQGGKFGTIEIRGTLSKPEYKFKVSVVDIIKSIKDTFFKKKE